MKWNKVEDELPPLDVPVLATDGTHYFIALRWNDERGTFFDSTICTCCNSEIGDPTHWHSLPPLPLKENSISECPLGCSHPLEMHECPHCCHKPLC